MSYKAEFNGWSELTKADLLVAYRKAKADNFFENNVVPTAIKFAEYESKLSENIDLLHKKLQKDNGFSKVPDIVGECRLIPKKMSIKHDDSYNNNHIHFSDPKRAFQALSKETTKVKREFRIVGDFPVNTHIISALWINMIGHKFDAALDDIACYASRLRRINGKHSCLSDAKEFNIEAIGSFQRYFKPYQNFRDDGIKAIRRELENDKDIIAVSLDLKSYFHTIDPMAIASPSLKNVLGLTGEKKLSAAENRFTRELARLLERWSNKAENIFGETQKHVIPGGLVIGLTASKIIANVLLHHWDKLIKEKLAPIYYGRYVDDMFFVLRDPNTIHHIDDFMALLNKSLGSKYFANRKNGNYCEILLGKAQGKSKIIFQPEKQKLFVLSGQTGLDLLGSIQKEILELSSERRLMPSPDDFKGSSAAKVLTTISGVGEYGDTLRRTDGLTIQRLSLSLQLKHIETLAHNLPKNEWSDGRSDFYIFAKNHILCPTNILNNFSYIPRILGLAISLDEWKEAICIAEHAFNSVKQVFNDFTRGSNTINGEEVKKSPIENKVILEHINEHLAWRLIDVAIRYYKIPDLFGNKRSSRKSSLVTHFIEHLNSYIDNFWGGFSLKHISTDFVSSSPSTDWDYAKLLEYYSRASACADLSSKPYKNYWLDSHSSNNLTPPLEEETFVASPLFAKDEYYTTGEEAGKELSEKEFIELSHLHDFLEQRNNMGYSISKNESTLPYLFPTRPYTPAEVAELVPSCIQPSENSTRTQWKKYVKVLRGIWIAVDAENDKPPETNKQNSLKIGSKKNNSVTIALSNFMTNDKDWSEMANDGTKLRLERYKRISSLVNQTIKLDPKPDYLVFPELSIPIQWINGVSAKLMAEGISLIAGAEYRHHSERKIYSEACFVLSDDALGFPSWVKIWQPKSTPAVGEEKDLVSKFGKTWECQPKHKDFPKKPIYNHNGFHFGLMICSELQNSKSRINFQGEVDALFVLAWNQDLDTFSSLIDSAALDIHAYTILVNNRAYGDSRVRSPAKKNFKRDLARVRGGENDFLVSVTLDIEVLRAFQSREKRWPEDTDEFKPVPEGYKISSNRRTIPST